MGVAKEAKTISLEQSESPRLETRVGNRGLYPQSKPTV